MRRDGDAALRALAASSTGSSADARGAARSGGARSPRSTPGSAPALERAARNIAARRTARFCPRALEVEMEPGVVVGRRPDPLARVGVYAPGGRAAYPSSVLMGVVPARVAGVREVIVLCSPPGPAGLPARRRARRRGDRRASTGCSRSAARARSPRMAYGTRERPRVDRIVGPGNA